MKSAPVSILIFMLSVGLCFAQQGERPRNPEGKVRLSGRVITPMAGKYSSMLNDMISTAEDMDITGEQRQKLSEIQNKYVTSLSKEEYEFKNLHFKILKKLEDPSFDPQVLKKEIKEANAINTNAANSFVDALVMVRDLLGKKMYEEVNKSIKQHEQELIQLRRKQVMKLRSQKNRRTLDTRTEESGDSKGDDTEKNSTDKKE